MNTRKLVLMSMLLGISLIIFIVESWIPQPVPVYGVKLGLANIIVLIAIKLLGRKEAFVILVLRILISSVFSGFLTSFLYSLAGGVLCFLVMSVMSLYIDRMWIISPVGAVFHNIGQICVACVLTGTWQVVLYVPILIISGIITGLFTGLTAEFIIKKINYVVRKFENIK